MGGFGFTEVNFVTKTIGQDTFKRGKEIQTSRSNVLKKLTGRLV